MVEQVVDPREFFAARLKELLRAAGLSQQKAATVVSERAKIRGEATVRITNGQISAWVNRTNRPSEAALRLLVRVLIEHARKIDADLVRDGRPARSFSQGLLDEQSWPVWLRAAWMGVARATTVTVRDADPIGLGVHRAAGPGTAARGAGDTGVWCDRLTPYLVRDHDRLLRQALAVAVGGGPAVFAVLLGESTTGKTRALYEAVLDQAGNCPLLKPADAEDLRRLLTTRAISPGTVLWLNETQRYLQADAGAGIAKHLIQLLEGTPGVVVVGAMWRTPYFADLTAQGCTPEPGLVRDLLLGSRTLLLDVPAALDPAEREEFRALACGSWPGQPDTRVTAALDAGALDDGRVIQYLSGGPELLAAYRNRVLFTAVEHALITAALDARRLGHHQPIPAALLAAAADGYLTARQRSSDPDWADTALGDLTRGHRRGDHGNRTDIRRTLTALVTHVTRSGGAAAYEPADYLDQHTRHDREADPGNPALWDALTTYTADLADLRRLISTATDKGLFKTAVLLSRRAVLAGAHSGESLIGLLTSRCLDPEGQGALWTARFADLTKAFGVGHLLKALQEADAGEALSQLLARRPAAHVDICDGLPVSFLLKTLHEVEAFEEVKALSDRVANINVIRVYDKLTLQRTLQQVGQPEAARILGTRPVIPFDVERSRQGIARLLKAVEELDTQQAGAPHEGQAAGKREEKKNAVPQYGWETDGRAASPWTWNDLGFPADMQS
ncbi:helix-turn-helix domain-containing protein [Streptomyces sp. NPDC020801]|uniref:helix-turn-helix domain-containing protein n=1 Tax=unclassified Streptomyces TaxID=2593676 RepID=UPI0037B4F56E